MTTIPSNMQWNAIETYIQDLDADPSESDDYATYWDMKAPNGDIVARLSADAHNHYGIYTRKHPLGHSSDKRIKRVNFEGGMENTKVRLMSPADSRFHVSAHGTPIVDLHAQDIDQRTCMYIDPQRETLRLTDIENNRSLLSFGLTEPFVNVHESPLKGLREIENPTSEKMATQEWAWDKTDNRWLYKDSEGEVHWFRPCGTL